MSKKKKAKRYKPSAHDLNRAAEIRAKQAVEAEPHRTEAIEMITTQPKCVLCERAAITTAVQFVVCAEHEAAYAAEMQRDLPLHERPIHLALLSTRSVVPLEIPLEQLGISPLREYYRFWAARKTFLID